MVETEALRLDRDRILMDGQLSMFDAPGPEPRGAYTDGGIATPSSAPSEEQRGDGRMGTDRTEETATDDATAERSRLLQLPACDRCTQGVVDTTNSHYLATCRCPCHEPRATQISSLPGSTFEDIFRNEAPQDRMSIR